MWKKILLIWCLGFAFHQVWAQTADFYATPLTSCENVTVFFVDKSSGIITTRDWDFGTDANPATATGVGPHIVTYSSNGKKEIKLKE